MKIHGTEGMSAENIRDEVNRGGRLIVYTYCISILVMTFKRSSEIRLIKAGHNPVTSGLPYTLISLIFGWWGIPWGPIYTIETIYRNLSGGIDVTEELMQAMRPVAGAPGVPPSVSIPSLRVEPTAPAGQFNYKTAVLMVAGAAALIVGGISIYCYNQTQHLTVLLVSGLDRPYSVSLNGEEHRLGANGHKVLTLPEGDFVLQDAAGGKVLGSPRTLNFSEPFFDHLGNERVAIINPDRAAILVREEVPYYNTNTTAPTDEIPAYTVLANQHSYFIEKSDYLLEKAPERISMSSGTTRLVKTRLEHVTAVELPGIVGLINEKLGYPAAREHLMILAGQRTDEIFLYTAVQTLKPEDQRAFFLTRLNERPVLVDWHRAYQSTTEYTFPDTDLEKEYRGYLKAEPGSGALLYLLGRVLPDRTEAKEYFQQALSASAPCPYAHNAFGYDAFCNAQFAEALECYRAAESAGVALTNYKTYRRNAYWGLRQFDTLLAEIRAERKTQPMNLELAAEEIKAILAGGQPVETAQKIKTDALNALKAAKTEKKALAEANTYLESVIAYQTGLLSAYVELVSHFDYPYYKFSAALTRGELEAAAQVAMAKPKTQATDLLLLYLLAKQKGDETSAEKHFAQSLEVMKKSSKEYKQAAALFTSAPSANAEKICALAINADDKCVLLTALGVRDPEHKAVYHGLAAKLDFMPDFPHQFLHGFLHPATSTRL